VLACPWRCDAILSEHDPGFTTKHERQLHVGTIIALSNFLLNLTRGKTLRAGQRRPGASGPVAPSLRRRDRIQSDGLVRNFISVFAAPERFNGAMTATLPRRPGCNMYGPAASIQTAGSGAFGVFPARHLAFTSVRCTKVLSRLYCLCTSPNCRGCDAASIMTAFFVAQLRTTPRPRSTYSRCPENRNHLSVHSAFNDKLSCVRRCHLHLSEEFMSLFDLDNKVTAAAVAAAGTVFGT